VNSKREEARKEKKRTRKGGKLTKGVQQEKNRGGIPGEGEKLKRKVGKK